MLPNLKHRHFILALAYTSANWNADTGGERTDKKVFEAVKTIFEAVPGKRISNLVPELSCWFDEMTEGGVAEQRSKHFTFFFNGKWALEVRFVVEKLRRVSSWVCWSLKYDDEKVESLLDRAAEVVVRRLETEDEVCRLKSPFLIPLKKQVEMLTIPRTLVPAVKEKFRDALWVCIFCLSVINLDKHLSAHKRGRLLWISYLYGVRCGATGPSRPCWRWRGRSPISCSPTRCQRTGKLRGRWISQKRRRE